ncbi:MAG: type I methionyl aminopeptidase [Patescibacteria group bacterium]
MPLIKTAADIVLLREAGKRHARILRIAAEMTKPGVETRAIDDRIYMLITQGDPKLGVPGGDQPSLLNFQPDFADRPFPASSCISVNEEVVHGIPNENNRVLKVGDIVSIDFGLLHKGVYTDAAVTVPVVDAEGTGISPAVQKLLDATKEALVAGIKVAKGGARVGDIGYAIEQVCKKHKLGLVEELCGHGVGNAAHEEPYVPNFGKRGDGMLLKPGMVLAIEPMFNLGTANIVLMPDGYTFRTADMKPSAHFEHTVLIREGDAEVLTVL